MSVALYQLSNKFGIKLRSDVCRDCRRSNRLLAVLKHLLKRWAIVNLFLSDDDDVID